LVSNTAFSEEFPDLNGKVIKFNGEPVSWPGSKFLEYHNKCFDAKLISGMKAAAETKRFWRQDTYATLNYAPEPALDPIKLWVEEQGKIEEYAPMEESEIIPCDGF
jgi:hypothetical protein